MMARVLTLILDVLKWLRKGVKMFYSVRADQKKSSVGKNKNKYQLTFSVVLVVTFLLRYKTVTLLEF